MEHTETVTITTTPEEMEVLIQMLDGKSLDPDFATITKSAVEIFHYEIPSDLKGQLEAEHADCKSKDERRCLMRRCFPWEKPCGTDCLYSLKSEENSELKRDDGNDKYVRKDFTGALEEYNRAVAMAPLNHKALGLAYANRAAALMGLEQAEDALKDIDRALANNYPEDKRPRLLERRSRCLDKIEKRGEFQEPQQTKSARELDVEKKRKTDKVMAKKFYDKGLFYVKSKNNADSSLDECVDVVEDERGKYFVVNRDVQGGTILMVDRPLVTVLRSDQLDSRGGFCGYCLKKIGAGIPCHKCVIAFYCDDSCRTKAWNEFHGSVECPCMSYYGCCFAGSDVKPGVLLLLRIISKLGPDHFYKLFELRSSWFSDPPKPSSIPPKLLKQFDYLKVYKLLTPPESPLLPSQIVGQSIQARIFVSILQKKTEFFSKIPPELKQEFKNFLIALVIQHFQSPQIVLPLKQSAGKFFTRNHIEHIQTKHDLGEEFLEALGHFVEMVDYGNGIYPLASSLRHSCDPNVILTPSASAAPGQAKLAVVASRGLRKGELLFFNRGPHYLHVERRLRQMVMRNEYYFTCRCLPCREDWPYIEVLSERDPRFCCPRCSRHFSYEEKGRKNFTECVLLDPLFKCQKCRNAYSVDKLHKQMDGITRKSAVIMVLLVEQRPYEIMKAALEAMKVHHQDFVCPPFFTAAIHQEVLKGALAHIVRIAAM